MRIHVEHQEEKEMIKNVIRELEGNSKYQSLIHSLRAALFQATADTPHTEPQACAGDNAWKNSDCWTEDIPE